MIKGMDAFAQAAGAYARALKMPTQPAGASDADAAVRSQPAFADMVRDSISDVIGSQKAAEQQAAAAVNGTGDLSAVVSAVAEADVTLQAVVAIRDRVIEAYKDIMRMPI